MTVKFYYNGIKDEKGAKLQTAHYSKGNYTAASRIDQSTITIYATKYCRFSKIVREEFKVINDTDTMVDYFESDKIRVSPDHQLYKEVHAAWEKQEARYAKKAA